jgi:hypothetical protein
VLLEQVAAITKPLSGDPLHISEGHYLTRIGLARCIEYAVEMQPASVPLIILSRTNSLIDLSGITLLPGFMTRS